MNLGVVGGVVGLALTGRGLWTWFRGGPLTVKSTGRAWATAGRASAFWLLLGAAALVVALLPIGARAGFIGPDAGFGIGVIPLALCCLAVTVFRPRRRATAG